MSIKILEPGIHGLRGGYTFDTSATLQKGQFVFIKARDETLGKTMVEDIRLGTSAHMVPGRCFMLYREDLDDELGTAAQDSISCGALVSLLGQGAVVETTKFETLQLVGSTAPGAILGVSTGALPTLAVSSLAYASWHGTLPLNQAGEVALLERSIVAGTTSAIRLRML